MSTHLRAARDAVAHPVAAGGQGNRELGFESGFAPNTLRRGLAALDADGTRCVELAPGTGPVAAASGLRLVLAGGAR